MDKARFTLLINLGNRHWVTLVLFYQNNAYEGYYIDSSPDPNNLSELQRYRDSLKARGVILNDLNDFLSSRQQSDAYNCGLWALENAADINNSRLQRNNQLLGWLILQLKRPRDERYFREKREYFSKKLRADLERENRLEIPEYSALQENGLESKQAKQAMKTDLQIVQEGIFLKRLAETDDNAASVNVKKLKSDNSKLSIEDEFFLSFYVKILDNVISNLSKNNKEVTIADLYHYLIIDTDELTKEKLNELIVLEEIQLESAIRELDKPSLLKQLKNIRKIDKYFSIILYKVDLVSRLINVFSASFMSPCGIG